MIKCKKCGFEIEEGCNNCSNCGEIVRKKYKMSMWNYFSIISLVCACFTLYKGYDKMTNYYSSEYYASLNVNAYVGGDAYNYIINGNYATAFFVLTLMFVVAAIGLLIVDRIERKGK